MTKKQALRFFAFSLLCAAMLLFFSWFLRDRATTLSSYYSVPNNSVSVAIVGSSHVNSGVIPAVFLQQDDISAHNVFSWDQPIWIAYYYLEEALKTQKLSVAVIDLYGMMYGNSLEQPEAIDDNSYKNSFSIDQDLVFLKMIGTVDKCGIDLRDPIDFLNLPRYHTRWKGVSTKYFTENAHKKPEFTKGWGIQTAEYAGYDPAAAIGEGQAAPQMPYETCVKYLDKIIALAKKRGVALVFTMLPYEYQANEPAIFQWLSDYSAAQGIPFLNYCTDAGREAGFDYTTDLADADHLNDQGARKVSAHLSAFLAKNEALPRACETAQAAQLQVDGKKTMRIIALADGLDGNSAALEAFCGDGQAVLLSAGDGTVALGRWQFACGAQGFALKKDGKTPQKKGFFPASTAPGTATQLLYDRVLDKPVCVIVQNGDGTYTWTDCGQQ